MVAQHSEINVHGSAQDATLIFTKQKFQSMCHIVGKGKKLSNKINKLLLGGRGGDRCLYANDKFQQCCCNSTHSKVHLMVFLQPHHLLCPSATYKQKTLPPPTELCHMLLRLQGWEDNTATLVHVNEMTHKADLHFCSRLLLRFHPFIRNFQVLNRSLQNQLRNHALLFLSILDCRSFWKSEKT